MNKRHDCIVVGSGPSGAMAAQTLVEHGVDTAMLDVGYTSDAKYHIPDLPFTDIRRTDPSQHEYFLGKDCTGIPTGNIHTAPQITPPRLFTTHGVEHWLPIESSTFHPYQSLAYGGLGNAWGLACFAYTPDELHGIGLDVSRTQDAYTTIAQRIGISGEHDDGGPYALNHVEYIQPAATLEPSMQHIYAAYQRRRKTIQRHGGRVGKTPLALLTQHLNGRTPTPYTDMDFWTNPGLSAYRPAITLNALKKQRHFTYYSNRLVLAFAEKKNEIAVTAQHTDTDHTETMYCTRLLLAAGTLGTARVIMRSFPNAAHCLPLLSGTYHYLACIQPAMFGKDPGTRKISYSQLTLFLDEAGDGNASATAMLYTYRSLLLFRLANQLPINYADAIRLLAYGSSSLVIAGIHHAEHPSAQKYIRRIPDASRATADVLQATYTLNAAERARHRQHERRIASILLRLGCIPMYRIDPGHGSSIHYGGTLPFDPTGAPYTLAHDGRLSGTRHIYIADGSGFRYLPPKGPTFTLMANAHVVATHVINSR